MSVNRIIGRAHSLPSKESIVLPFILGSKELYALNYNLLKLKDNTAQRIVDAIWVLILDGKFNPELKEIVNASGISSRTILANSKEIKIAINIMSEYFCMQICEHIGLDQSEPNISAIPTVSIDGVAINIPTRLTPLLDIEKVGLALGFSYDSVIPKLEGFRVKEYLQSLVLVSLREHKILTGTMSSYKQQAFSENFLALYTKVLSGSGRIYSKDKHRRWFYELDNNKSLNKLLVKDSSYQANNYCMSFEPTGLGDKVMARALELFDILEFEDNSSLYDKYSHILVPRNIITDIKFRDAITLLSNTIGFSNGSFIVELNIQDTLVDRVYSVFTSISSDTRLKLGYINYDIGAALQTIALQLVEDDELYPLHKELVNDKVSFRSKIMEATNKSLSWVKQLLSKLDNMENYTTSIDILAEYFQESRCLRDEILNSIKETNCDIYNIAFIKASDILHKEWDELDLRFKFSATGEKKESSVFFFIWTQFERQIRQAMKLPFADQGLVIDVHDAVYSKEDVDIALIERAVFENTGFRVWIGH